MTRRDGFALLIVLWSLALLAIVGAQIVGAGRTEASLAANLREAAAAEAAADGAVFQAAWQVMGGKLPVGAARLAVGGIPVGVRVEDEGTRISLNRAGQPLMTALLRDLGLDPAVATVEAARLAEWRSPSPAGAGGAAKSAAYASAGLPYAPWNQPYDDASELGLVLGMTPRLVALLAPHVSAYGDATTGAVDTVVGDALQDAGQAEAAVPVAPPGATPAYPSTIRIAATAEGAARVTRIAVLRLTPSGPRVLAWDRS